MENKSGQTTNSRSGARKRSAAAANTETQENNMADTQMNDASEGTTSNASAEPKSLGSVIAQSLATESQEAIDRGMSQLNDYFRMGKEYVDENPREAAGLAVAAGFAAWALLSTKPGRHLFELGAATLVPKAARWVSRNFSGIQH